MGDVTSLFLSHHVLSYHYGGPKRTEEVHQTEISIFFSFSHVDWWPKINVPIAPTYWGGKIAMRFQLAAAAGAVFNTLSKDKTHF